MPPERDNVSVDFVDKWKRKRTNQDGHIGLTLLIDRLWMRISFISLSHQCVPLWRYRFASTLDECEPVLDVLDDGDHRPIARQMRLHNNGRYRYSVERKRSQ